MPFWPWYMALCVGLMFYGRNRGGLTVPAIILGALIAMRVVMWGIDPTWRELAAYTVWLCAAMALMYKGAWVPGALCLLSGVTYPTLLVLGVRIEYLGMSPIIADSFLLLALGAGWIGLVGRSNSGLYRDRMADNGQGFAVGMAALKMRHIEADRRNSEIKAGR